MSQALEEGNAETTSQLALNCGLTHPQHQEQNWLLRRVELQPQEADWPLKPATLQHQIAYIQSDNRSIPRPQTPIPLTEPLDPVDLRVADSHNIKRPIPRTRPPVPGSAQLVHSPNTSGSVPDTRPPIPLTHPLGPVGLQVFDSQNVPRSTPCTRVPIPDTTMVADTCNGRLIFRTQSTILASPQVAESQKTSRSAPRTRPPTHRTRAPVSRIRVDHIMTIEEYRLEYPEKIAAARVSLDRRGTEYCFLPDPGHSAPTIANSRLDASVSRNDLSQPNPKTQRPIFPVLKRGDTPSKPKPSRIPTPVGMKGKASPRNSSTPAFPDQKMKKENVPLKTHRLLGPISPSRNRSSLPRPRTLGMLSTLANNFSRSNLSLHSNKSAVNFAPTSDPTISTTGTSSPPLPTFTTNIRQIQNGQPSNYWCGRFQTLASHFQQETLEAAMTDPKVMASYIPKRDEPLVNKFRFGRFKKDDLYERTIEAERKAGEAIDKLMEEEEEERFKEVLRQLEALCVTTETKESFWEWQQAYARSRRNKNYLPAGGCMVDGEKEGWASRVFNGGPGYSPTLGAMRKKASSLSMRERGQAQKCQRHDVPLHKVLQEAVPHQEPVPDKEAAASQEAIIPQEAVPGQDADLRQEADPRQDAFQCQEPLPQEAVIRHDATPRQEAVPCQEADLRQQGLPCRKATPPQVAGLV